MIKVNEYVRTKNGYIIRVDKNTNIFNLGYKEQYIDMETTRYGFTCEEEIVNHSKQLIDLIEVGDYVNGKYVKEIKGYGNGKYILALIGIIEEQDIKTILTKEIYMANCYKVGEEDE